MNNLKSFDDFLGEGFFDFLKDKDTIDFTKPDKKPDESKEKTGISRWLEYLKDKEYRDFTKPDKKPSRNDVNKSAYYKRLRSQEEEEEEDETPSKTTKTSKITVPRSISRRANQGVTDAEYWNDENVKKREMMYKSSPNYKR